MVLRNFDPIWDEIYESGQQLNKYPYTTIVSFLSSQTKPFQDDGSRTKLLEIGCGAGNNIWFAAREGYDVTGIDASKAAILFAKKRFDADGLKCNLKIGDFSALPFDDNLFDVGIERAALSQVPKQTVPLVLRELCRVLKRGAPLHVEIYSDRSTSRGEENEGQLIDNVTGPFSGVGQIGFYSKAEIKRLFSENLLITSLRHTETQNLTSGPIEVQAFWSVDAVVEK